MAKINDNNIDKGKNNKLLSNKRGVTLSNKIFKLFGRVINSRIKETLQIHRRSSRGKRKESCS